MSKNNKPTQEDYRRGIDVGDGLNQVSPVMYWYRAGMFKNEDEARGAFKLADQQAIDGMGKCTAQWMGMTDDEYQAWFMREELPKL